MTDEEKEKRRQAKLEIFINDAGKLGYTYEDGSGGQGAGGEDVSEEQVARDVAKLIPDLMSSAGTKEVLNGLKNWAGMQRRRKPGQKVKGEQVVLKEWFYTLSAQPRYTEVLPDALRAAVQSLLRPVGMGGLEDGIMGAAQHVEDMLAAPLIHVCIAQDGEGRSYRGIAICNLYDDPVESTGRNIARGRAYQAWHSKEKGEVITCEPELQIMRLCGAPEWLYKSEVDPTLSPIEQELVSTVEK